MYFEDFEVGDQYEFGEREITEEAIVDFAQQFDPQPFHLDPELAESSYFGRLVASGMHTLAAAMRVAVDGFYREVENVAGKGMDAVRFQRPLLPGTVISVSSTVLEKSEASRHEHGTVRSKWVVTDGADNVILTLEMIEIIRRRSPVNG